MTECAFVAGALAHVGNIRAIIASLLGVVLVTTLLISANSTAITLRERIGEVALLRTLGFDRKRIALLLFGEALLIGLVGSTLGAGGAAILFAGGIDLGPITNGFALISFGPALAIESLLAAIAVTIDCGTNPIAGALRVAPAIGLRKVV